MTSPERFRRSYESARANGYNGTRAEFARLVLGLVGSLSSLKASALAWVKVNDAPRPHGNPGKGARR